MRAGEKSPRHVILGKASGREMRSRDATQTLCQNDKENDKSNTEMVASESRRLLK